MFYVRVDLIFFGLVSGSTITFEGKLRKNSTISNRIFKDNIKSITSDMLWPDAWKLSIKIKDLTPNNFNTYINYLTGNQSVNTNVLRQSNKSENKKSSVSSDKSNTKT